MIEVSIAHDKLLNGLSDFAQLLYLKILPHTDDWGRFEGDPEVVKARVDPLSRRPVAKYDAAMREISGAGLWTWFQTEKGHKVVQYKQDSFERINAFLIKQRKNAEFPPHKDSYELVCGVMPVITLNKQQVISKEQRVKSKEKEKFGEFQNVLLTSVEHGKLIQRLTSERAKTAIEILSRYKESSGKKYSSDYATFHTWVIGELEKREKENGAHQSGSGRNNQERSVVTRESAQRSVQIAQQRIDERNRRDSNPDRTPQTDQGPQ